MIWKSCLALFWLFFGVSDIFRVQTDRLSTELEQVWYSCSFLYTVVHLTDDGVYLVPVRGLLKVWQVFI